MAQTTYQIDDKYIDVTLAGTVSSGDVVEIGNIIGIATIDGVSADVIALDTKGQHTLTSDTGTAYSEGDYLYWDSGNTRLTKTSIGNTFIGIASKDKASAATSAQVRLTGRASPGVGSQFIIVAAGEFTTVGGDADETITVTGALATDLVLVTLHTAGATPVTVVDAAAAAGQIDVDMSADPSTDHILTYMVLRAV